MEQDKEPHFSKEEKEPLYASIMSDYGFKVTFGNENNTLFLRKAIQLLIKSKIPIRHISFIRNEVSGLTKTARGAVYDIACEDEKQNVFIVEMQMVDFKKFVQRSKFYGFHVFNKMVQKGKYSFTGLKDVYVISFLAGHLFESKEFHHICNLRNQRGQKLDSQLTFVFLELGKWNKELHQIKNDLDKLIYIMKMTDSISRDKPYQLPHFLSEEWIETAMKELELGNMTPDERMAYEMEMARVGSIISAFEEKVEEIEAKQKEIEAKAKEIKNKDKEIENRDKVIEDKEKAIEEKNQLLEELEKEKQLAQQKLEEEKRLAQKEEKILIVKQLILTKTMNLEQIASIVNLPIKEVTQINEQIKNKIQ